MLAAVRHLDLRALFTLRLETNLDYTATEETNQILSKMENTSLTSSASISPLFCSLIHFSYHLSATIHMSMHHFPLLSSSIHISKSFIFVSIAPFSLGKALPGSGKRNSGPLVSVSLLGHSAKCSFFHIMSPPTQLSHHHCSSSYPFLPSLNIFAPPLL